MPPTTPNRDAPDTPYPTDADALKSVIRRFLDEAENIREYPRSYDMGHLKQLASALARRADACAESAQTSETRAAALNLRRLARAAADAVMPMTHENARPIAEIAIPMARELAELVEALYPNGE